MTCDGNCAECPTALTRHASQPEGLEAALYGDVWVKPWVMPAAGMIVPQHAHTYDHLSAIAQGSVRVWQDGEDMGVTKAPGLVRVPARVKHAFEVLEAGTVILCIHNAAHGEAAEIHEEHHLVEG
jgi:hypothetical protein